MMQRKMRTSGADGGRRPRNAGGTEAAAPRDTRTRLLDAALELFDEHGFEGFTVHAVVAQSGISLGSLYHHFGSMDGLSAALYSRCMGRLLDDIGAALDGAGEEKSLKTRPKGPRALIVAIVRSYLAFTARERTAAMFIHLSPSERFLPAHAASIAADKAPRLERITRAIRPHVRSGAIARLPEPLLEMLIIGPAAEIARRWLSGAPGIDLEEASRLVPERIWRSVRA
jgi:AcrR family transcriptional regulator